jgi:hypothetical protein
MKVEVILQFDVPDDSDIDILPKLLRDRINNFDYHNELVQTCFITRPEKSLLYKEERLEYLERVVSGLKELLYLENRSIDADNFLSTHNRYLREQREER